MAHTRALNLLVLILIGCVYQAATKPQIEHHVRNEFAVYLAEGISHIEGFEILGPVGNLPNIFLVRSDGVTVASSSSLEHLQSHPDVKWAQQQVARQQYTRNAPPSKKQRRSSSKSGGESAEPWLGFVDPLFPDQWHLVNTGQMNGSVGEDISVKGAWELGYSGKGVRIAIVDDGFQYTHPDLASAYQNDSSHNYNSGNPLDPAPDVRYDYHGTSCAGVALARNNSACGVGAAFWAEGAGLRLISDPSTDAEEAQALTFQGQKNHIYSNSWGPYDDGTTLAGPGRLTQAAMQEGVKTGRGGLGSIYVWAAGNGLESNDNCNYDGYANAQETIAVGAIDNNGVQSYYSEPCAAMLICAPSSSVNIGITTTDLLGTNGYDDTECTADFGGTSSACPLAAGVVALILEANNKLTWRDVQYILLTTASQNDPKDSDWIKNGAGHMVNHKYGFGRINATAAVKAAVNHETVPSLSVFNSLNISVNRDIVDNNSTATISSNVTVDDSFNVEWVEVIVNINHTASGDLSVVLVSPQGTESILAELHGLDTGSIVNVTNVPDLDEFVFGAVRPYYYGGLGDIVGNVVLPPNNTFCTNVSCNGLEGNIALLALGVCSGPIKALNAQTCGASGVIVVNYVAGGPYPMPGSNSSGISIPIVMVSLTDGTMIRHLIENGTDVEVSIMDVPVKIPIDAYNNWRFSTVRNWGEDSKGIWSLKVTDNYIEDTGIFQSWQLNVYGANFKKPSKDHTKWIILGVILGVAAIGIAIGALMYVRNRRKRGYATIDGQRVHI